MINRLPLIGEQGKKEPVKRKSVSYEHQKVIHQFLKCISDCDMSDTLKMVLRMKVWGVKPDVFYPMTYQQIAFVLVKDDVICKNNKVAILEEIGKYLKGIDTFGMDKVRKNKVVKKAVNEVKKLENEGLAHIKAHLVKCGLLNIEYRFASRGIDRIKNWMGMNKRMRI